MTDEGLREMLKSHSEESAGIRESCVDAEKRALRFFERNRWSFLMLVLEYTDAEAVSELERLREQFWGDPQDSDREEFRVEPDEERAK